MWSGMRKAIEGSKQNEIPEDYEIGVERQSKEYEKCLLWSHFVSYSKGIEE